VQETVILSDDIPLLSPALGFHEDVALVTVSIIERTQDKRLRSQPYLVTSDRKLKLYRLDAEQILALNGKALIPTGD
jgi:hypothetical protein